MLPWKCGGLNYANSPFSVSSFTEDQIQRSSSNAENYRPVSILNAFGKVFERFVYVVIKLKSFGISGPSLFIWRMKETIHI